jgi:hypothetical protein
MAGNGDLPILRHDAIPEEEILTTDPHPADSKSTNVGPSSDRGRDEPSSISKKWVARVLERFSRKNPDTSLFHPLAPTNPVMTPCYPALKLEDVEPASDYRSAVSKSTYYTALSRLDGRSVKDVPGQLKE